jgi:hypothetical protein
MVSTMKRAGWAAAFIACLTSGMRDTTPVEVSLCTTHTALMRSSVSARKRFSMASGSAPWRQSPARNSTSRPRRAASFCHKLAKCPVSAISTRSPAESEFTSAASHAPVPEAG